MEKQAAMKERQKPVKRPRQKKKFIVKLCNRCVKPLLAGESRYCAECTNIQKSMFTVWEDTVIKRLTGHGLVYFLQADIGGPIKIGYTRKQKIYRRINELQTGNPYPLRFIGVINDATKDTEKSLHKKFAHIRLCGEWFKDCSELIDYIKDKATTTILK